jgi:ATP-dependent Clp protease ATP-binding subunit ClpA
VPGGLPLTDRAQRVLKQASKEQERLGHATLTAAHILHGLLADRRSMSAYVLRQLKLDEQHLAERVRSELERMPPNPLVDEAALVRAAGQWATSLKQVSIGTEHLLLALIGSDSPAGAWLREAGVRQADAKNAIELLFGVIHRRSGPTERIGDA